MKMIKWFLVNTVVCVIATIISLATVLGMMKLFAMAIFGVN